MSFPALSSSMIPSASLSGLPSTTPTSTMRTSRNRRPPCSIQADPTAAVTFLLAGSWPPVSSMERPPNEQGQVWDLGVLGELRRNARGGYDEDGQSSRRGAAASLREEGTREGRESVIGSEAEGKTTGEEAGAEGRRGRAIATPSILSRRPSRNSTRSEETVVGDDDIGIPPTKHDIFKPTSFPSYNFNYSSSRPPSTGSQLTTSPPPFIHQQTRHLSSRSPSSTRSASPSPSSSSQEMQRKPTSRNLPSQETSIGLFHPPHVDFDPDTSPRTATDRRPAPAVRRESVVERKTRDREQRGCCHRHVADARRYLRWVLTQETFHLVVIVLVVLDLLLVFSELIVALLTAGCTSEREYELILAVIELREEHLTPASFACSLAPTPSRERLEQALFVTNLIFLSIFELEVVLSLFAFGPIRYLTSWISLLDGLVVTATFGLDLGFHLAEETGAGHSAAALVILRFWKVIRAVHAIAHTLELHHQSSLSLKKQALDALLREKVAETLRLSFVRQHLIAETGKDVDPETIEAKVRAEMEVWEEGQREAQEEARARSDKKGFWSRD